MKWAAVLAVLVVPAIASANVWQHAIDADPQRDVYNNELQSGDELAEQATAQASASKDAIHTLVTHAAQAYRNAAAAEPAEAEPYYRLGRLLYHYYCECSVATPSPLCISGYFDRKHAQEAIDAWDAFEARAPLDPRLTTVPGDLNIGFDFNFYFERAILHTKLADRANLEAATHDYETLIARTASPDVETLGNLAETYMMLDRLDDAIEMYRRALRVTLQDSTVYGLAVALDRDDRGEEAKRLIRAQGEQSVQDFEKRIADGEVFFVPAGEEDYYLALIYEAFDLNDAAIDQWNEYLRSGAHPEFQPRANAHLAALLADRKRHKATDVEVPWHDIYR